MDICVCLGIVIILMPCQFSNEEHIPPESTSLSLRLNALSMAWCVACGTLILFGAFGDTTVLVMGPCICIYVQQGRTLCLTVSFVSGYKLGDVSASRRQHHLCWCRTSPLTRSLVPAKLHRYSTPFQSIMKSVVDICKALYACVVLSGGTTMFHGFGVRM